VKGRTEGSELVLAVEDDGPGLRKGQEEAVFAKFARGDKAPAAPGMGLGLAICRAIVQAHRGTIVADPAVAKGARFVVRLPLGTPPAVEVVP